MYVYTYVVAVFSLSLSLPPSLHGQRGEIEDNCSPRRRPRLASRKSGAWQVLKLLVGALGHVLTTTTSALLPFLGEGSPTKADYKKKVPLF